MRERTPLHVAARLPALVVLLLGAGLCLEVAHGRAAEEKKLLNASYDVSREFYGELNPAFEKTWQQTNGGPIVVEQSHQGSSKQARAVIDGLEADVVTLNQIGDIDALVKAGLVNPDWRDKFPNHSSAYKSVSAFVVRKGNPKQINDWGDLVRDDVKIALVNPKTGGNGRYVFLAAYGFALQKFGGDRDKANAFVKKLYENVPVLDTGGRAATTTFAQRGIADVLITFEAEAHMVKKEFPKEEFQVVLPSVSVLADFPLAIVDKIADKRGTRAAAEAYLAYIGSEPGQEIAARNFYRPNLPTVAEKYAKQFPEVTVIDVDEQFGGWTTAQQTFFNDGGVFDQIYTAGK
jgi:sulfate/thiosulfate-binding protein